ncbi:hypothetical protein L596_001378 [Steinernema carpocapsae]|uniref:Uncharacterized protein n=1 Tax=Steinernema carpocapsae TaxID=34508 RepID=A0A4U8UL32_STECR|nr:hypothetical protein L596_001378 [Steinernema carpocapsae]
MSSPLPRMSTSRPEVKSSARRPRRTLSAKPSSRRPPVSSPSPSSRPAWRRRLTSPSSTSARPAKASTQRTSPSSFPCSVRTTKTMLLRKWSSCVGSPRTRD